MEKILSNVTPATVANVKKAKASKPVKKTARNAKTAKTIGRKEATTTSEGAREELPKLAQKAFVSGDFKAINNSDADKAIASIRKSGMALKRQAHITACGIMLHYVEHGDYTKLDLLHDAIREAMSKAMAKGFRDWVIEFSSLTWNDDEKRFRHTRGAEKTFQLHGDANAPDESNANKGAMNIPFYSGSFGDKEHVWDFDTAFAKFIETARREMKRKTEASAKEAKRIKVSPEQITALEKSAALLGVPVKAAA